MNKAQTHSEAVGRLGFGGGDGGLGQPMAQGGGSRGGIIS